MRTGCAAALRMLGCRWLTVKWRYWKGAECLTQHQLQESLRGPEFELDQRYGAIGLPFGGTPQDSLLRMQTVVRGCALFALRV
jgi:hypothetical protein